MDPAALLLILKNPRTWRAIGAAVLLAVIVSYHFRLAHAHADLKACATIRAADEATLKRLQDQSKRDTARAQAGADAGHRGETAAAHAAAQILKPRGGSPSDCGVARQVIRDALK